MSSQRRQAVSEAEQQQRELDQQRTLAETQQVASLQDSLQSQTNQTARLFGTRALLASNGLPGRAA